MPRPAISRRAFLRSAADLAPGSLVALSLPAALAACREAGRAVSSGAGFKTLTAREGAELAAIAARIIPTDDTPGAAEAGAVHFMDHVLGDGRPALLAAVREGLEDLRGRIPAGTEFHRLSGPRQDEVLREIEDGAFFATARYLTIAGVFSLPAWGGNRGGFGYRIIGFEDARAWAPPYGAYDADYAERGE